MTMADETEVKAPQEEIAPAKDAAPEPAPQPVEPPPPTEAPPAEPTTTVESGAPKPAETAEASPLVSDSIDSSKKQGKSITRTSKREESLKKSRLSRDFIRTSSKNSKNYYSMISIKRGSLASFQERGKAPKYMNSYKLDSDKPFNVDKVHSIIAAVLKQHITEDLIYDENIPEKTKAICGQIRSSIKEQNYDRYKIFVLTTIGEKKSYDLCCVVRFLWDQERDKLAYGFAENMYLFCTASAYGLYFE